jgi:hypothetical protein
VLGLAIVAVVVLAVIELLGRPPATPDVSVPEQRQPALAEHLEDVSVSPGPSPALDVEDELPRSR